MSHERSLIDALGLAPHPEGGWYRETWRGAEGPDGRAIGTAILYLLPAGERSHWHRVDAAEFWLWHAGSPVCLSTSPTDAGPASTFRLGPDVLIGEQPQHLVPAHFWQSAEADSGWALVSCVVVPGFRFEGFTLAARGWAPAG